VPPTDKTAAWTPAEVVVGIGPTVTQKLAVSAALTTPLPAMMYDVRVCARVLGGSVPTGVCAGQGGGGGGANPVTKKTQPP
jgi:hypothetical protein